MATKNNKSFLEKLQTKEVLMGSGALFLFIASVLAVVLIAGAVLVMSNIERSEGQSNTITVTGQGEVSATPDIATISFSVKETAKNFAEAQEAAAVAINETITALAEFNIPEEDIKTSDYNGFPLYEYQQELCAVGEICPPEGKRVLVGYEISQTVTVKVREVDQAGEVLALLGGFDISNLYGPNFEIDDDKDLQGEAREQAIQDARAKAKELALQLGVRLGKVVSFSEGGGGSYPMMARAEMMSFDVAADEEAKVVPQLPTGENTVTSYVTITYKIR